jgi:hypothetical protein
MESIACHPRALASLPFINSFEKIQAFILQSYNTLLAWKAARRYLKIPDPLSLRSPIALNPDFPPTNKEYWTSGLEDEGYC